ncbi:D-aminoacyl-tRNA deacylase 1-like [Anneissia japonica]|uniref:D-aminoacyl-tRNA deacylase 1-like n=1 Tax=Anneissia japonica TaxID=1529436 RepID=UPI001425680B|nr:D-aminoacyl-tRNA deacylase 1-like [Anneissia japonica]
MKVVIQRVTKASVSVGDELVSSIGRGLCVLVGITKDDTPKEREYIARKVLNLRVFDDDAGKRWSKSVKDKQFEILCVSQFTLYAILKGNKPDFHCAMPGEKSRLFYEEFLQLLQKDYKPAMIKDGKFGAYMQVHIQNDGPVTIQIDSPTEIAAEETPKKPSTLERKAGSKTPVAVVKAQPKERTTEKTRVYINKMSEVFPEDSDIQSKFLQVLQKYKERSMLIAELMLNVCQLFSGHKDLLCGFSTFLPSGHSITIQNNDPQLVRVRLPQSNGMTLDRLKEHVNATQCTRPEGAEGHTRSLSSGSVSIATMTPQMDELINLLESTIEVDD